MKKQFNFGACKSKFLQLSCALLLAIALFSFLAAADNISPSSNIIPQNKISTSLSLKMSNNSANEQIPVIILLTNQHIAFNTVSGKSQIEHDQNNILTHLENARLQNKAQNIKSLKLVNAVAAKLSPEVITSLSKLPEISLIEPDEIISIPEKPEIPDKMSLSLNKQGAASANAWGVDKIGAPLVWQNGITGNGIIVAVIDTGIDATHPDLMYLPNTNTPKVIGWKDFVNGRTSPYDDNYHGTHVSGTISGTGTDGLNTGVAPGTKLLVAKVFDNQGRGYESSIVQGFEWAIENGAYIINFSGGSRSHYVTYATAINNAVAAGVIPVICAGNNGPGASTIWCPGDEINSITVGATDSSDTIASFSSRGSVTLNGQRFIKPDVSAPGVAIRSTLPIWEGYPYYPYYNLDGTSMATPHVSGTVALMLEHNPSLTSSQVKSILENTAKDLGPIGDDNSYGYGRINAYNAVFGNTQDLTASFSASPTSGYAPLAVTFTDKSTGSPTNWNWSFGDGATSTVQNPKHTYSKAGTYSVSLTVFKAGRSKKVTYSYYISVTQVPKKPTATFTANVRSGKAPLSVNFVSTTTGNPTNYYWVFEPSTSSDWNSHHAVTAVHRFTKKGTYTISLTVTNAAGSTTVTNKNYITVK